MNKNYPVFAETAIGSVITRPALCSAIAENLSKTGKPFVKVTLKDGSGEVTAMMFDMSTAALADLGVTAESIVDVKLSVGEYQGAKNYKIVEIKPCTDPEMSISDFVKLPPVDPDIMYDEICATIQRCSGEHGGKYAPVADLALKILADTKKEYMTSSAAVSMHHNLRGGLLYHSYRMVQAAEALCSVYSILDKELMICGAALHDIGKIWEYSTTEAGDAAFTAQGVLFGHLYIGASYIRTVSRDVSCDPERVRMLIHMILSHHGTQEWGAVACPATPEAFALHYIDNIDAKIYVCEEAYEQLKGGELTEKKPFGLDNRLYKPDFPDSEEE